MQPCKTLCNDTWKVHNLGCFNLFWSTMPPNLLCTASSTPTPIIVHTHKSNVTNPHKRCIKSKQFCFCLQFFYVYESCILHIVVCSFFVVLGLHSSGLPSKMHFESSKVIWKHMYKKWYLKHELTQTMFTFELVQS